MIKHDKGPAEDPASRRGIPPDVQKHFEAIQASDYYHYVLPLKALVAGKRVTRSQAGHSGFILFFDDDTWVASFLQNDRLEWLMGEGSSTEEALGLLSSAEYGDAEPPIAADLPYSDETCKIAEQVANAHGMTIETLAYGMDSFNFAFPDDHELETLLVPTADGKLGLRVFWEQW